MKKVISYIFSFFLAFFLFILTVLCVIRFNVASESYFLKQLDKADYYESAVEGYNRLLKQNARPTNFPIELFDNYVKTVDVIDDMKESVKAGFNGKSYEASTDVIKQRLKDTTNGYIQENQIAINSETQTAIDTFIDANTTNYAKLLQFPYIEYIGKGINVFHKIFWMAAGGLSVLCLLLAFAQIRMHKSRRRRKRWLAYSFMGAGLMSSIMPAMLLSFKVFDRIQIEPEYLYRVLTAVLNGTTVVLLIVGILWVILGVFLTYFKPKKKNKSKKQERSYDHSVKLDSIIPE